MKPKFRKGQIVRCSVRQDKNFLKKPDEYYLVLKSYKGTNDMPLYKVWAIGEGIMTESYLGNNHIWNYKVYKHDKL